MAQPHDALENSFGRIAIAQGWATPAQVNEALDAMRKLAELGFREKLGEIMVKKGYLTPDQVTQILQIQGARAANRIKGYEILSKLGQGGMGAVYKARQLSLDRPVALKILSPHLAKDKAYIERFLREARAVAKLNHPNIIQGIDVGECDGNYYFAMEFVDGPTLSEVIHREGPLEEPRALKLTAEIARALEHAHKHGLVHRDIKPDNIMLTKTGEAKLCDLGLAKFASSGDAGATSDGRTVLGTPHYISPEQARGEKDIDIRSDIYSLGATCFHAVTGRTPFVGTNPPVIMTKHLTELVDDPRELREELSEGIALLIGKMMAKDPAHRQQDPTELLKDIELVSKGKLPRIGPEVKLGIKRAPTKAPATELRRKVRIGSKRSVRPATNYAILGGLTLLLLAAAYIFWPWLSRKLSKPSPPPPVALPASPAVQDLKSEARKEDPATIYEEAVAFASRPDKSESFLEVFGKLRAAEKLCAGTPYEAKAREALAEARARQAELRRKRIEEFRARAAELIALGRYREAYDLWGNFPEELLPESAAEGLSIIDPEQRTVLAAAQAAFAEIVKEAHEKVKSGAYEEARKKLASAEAIGLDKVISELPAEKKRLEAAISRHSSSTQKRTTEAWDALREELYALARNGEFAVVRERARKALTGGRFAPFRSELELIEHDASRLALRQESALEGLAAKVGKPERVPIHKGPRGYSAEVLKIEGDKITIRPVSSPGETVEIKLQELAPEDIRKFAPISLSDADGNYDYGILLLYMGSPEQAKPFLERTKSHPTLGPRAREHIERISKR